MAVLAGLVVPAAADEPQSKPTTTAQTTVLKTTPDALPKGMKNFNGMLVGRLAAKDVERGTFVLRVDAVARVWENSKAEDPQSIVGKTVAVNGVFGKFLDVLVVTRTGETLEFECKHDGDQLKFPGELLRKVAPYTPEDYPKLPEEYGPMSTGEKPRHGQPFRVRGITLDESLTVEKYRSRRRLRNDIDTAFDGFEELDDSVRGLDRFSEQAYRIISSPRSRNAFDLSREPDREVDRFGRHEFGQSAMLATRLIEAGVRFVTVLLEGWDTHQDNFNTLGRELLPGLDQSFSAMLDRLEEQGLLESTSILVTGEFGRTPKVNHNAGRDHWSRAMCALMAGGSVRAGQVIGSTDDKAEGPDGDGFTPDDLAATFFKDIGIDPKTEYNASVGRPITLVRDGSPIPGVLA